MSYAIAVSREHGWVEVRHEGMLTATEMYDARHKSAEVLRQESLTRILVDTRAADFSNLSFTDRFQFNATHQAEFAALSRVRIALVVPAQRLPEASFSETVARNRGTSLRAFADWDEACEWLAADSAD